GSSQHAQNHMGSCLLLRWLQALKTKQLHFARCLLNVLTNTEANTLSPCGRRIAQKTRNTYLDEISLGRRFSNQIKLIFLQSFTEEIIILRLLILFQTEIALSFQWLYTTFYPHIHYPCPSIVN